VSGPFFFFFWHHGSCASKSTSTGFIFLKFKAQNYFFFDMFIQERGGGFELMTSTSLNVVLAD
jgi:hypothetical protein